MIELADLLRPLYLFLGVVGAYCIYNRYFHPLAKVPGPFLASITPLWLVWQCMHYRRPRLDVALHRQYGPVVRIKPDEVVFSNADYYREVYGAGTRFDKSIYYDVLPGAGVKAWEHLDMLSERNMPKLRLQKRLGVPIYSEQNTLRHESLIDDSIRRWTGRLSGLAGKPLDLYPEIELFDVDLLTEITFGKPYGAIEAGSDGGHMEDMWEMWKLVGWIGFVPSLGMLDKHLGGRIHAGLSKLEALLTFGRREKLISNPLDRYALPIYKYVVSQIAEFDKATEEGQATESCLLNDFRQLSVKKSDFVQLWGTRFCLTNLGAGVDTMSWTQASIIIGICSNPQVYAKVQAEIDAAVAKGAIIRGEPVPFQEAANLEYLQACMREAQRKWPNIAVSLPRTVPPEGVTMDGFHIPGGYIVGMNSTQLGLSEAVFGPDTEEFKPERWTEASKEQRQRMEAKNLAFGGTSRKCPGMHMAWTCMTKVMASLFLEYNIRVLNELDGKPGPGGHIWREEGTFPSKWLGLEVELRKRQ